MCFDADEIAVKPENFIVTLNTHTHEARAEKMYGDHVYDSMTDTKHCDVINKWHSDSPDCFVHQNQWEHEQIYRSLKDSNCDDVIKILLAESQKPSIEQIYCDIDEHNMTYGDGNIIKPTASNVNSVNGSHSSIEWRAKKPLPKSSNPAHVINLDKNRINLRRARTKLLPRPISLPSSLKLFRNFNANNSTASDKQFGKVDLEFIKRLEDNIYSNRDEYQHITNNINCDQSNRSSQRYSYEPTQIVERIRFDDKLVKFNQNQHLVLLLDTWQLQPLLLRCDNNIGTHSNHSAAEKPTHVNEHCKETSIAKRSIAIVDNSSFYPVFMTYELGTAESSAPQSLHNGWNAHDSIQQSQSEKDFTNLFRARVEQLAKQYQMTNQWNASCEVRPLLDNASDEKTPKGAAKSSFARFMQRVRSRTKTKTNKLPQVTAKNRACEIFTKTAPLQSQRIPITSTEQNNNNRLLGDGMTNTNKIDYDTVWQAMWNQKTKLTEHNIKLKWLMCTKPKIDAFKVRLVKRRHSVHGTCTRSTTLVTMRNTSDKHSLNGAESPIIIKPNDYDLAYCERFRMIGWSCSDLLAIQGAERLRKFYVKQDKYHRRMRSKWQSDKIEPQCVKNISDSDNNSLVSGEVVVRKNAKRRSSFRLKRHSIDSATAMTDVVKAWVYRKRFQLISSPFKLYCAQQKLASHC